METPHWKLAESLEVGPLFEALVRRFGKGDDSPLRNDAVARTYYLLGQIDKAVAFVEADKQRSDHMTRRAVTVDGDYLNAWKQFGMELPAPLHIPRAERDAALLNILRLDPLKRSSCLGHTRYLPGWQKFLRAAAVSPLPRAGCQSGLNARRSTLPLSVSSETSSSHLSGPMWTQ